MPILTACPAISHAELGRQLGVSPRTARRIRQHLEPVGKHDRPDSITQPESPRTV